MTRRRVVVTGLGMVSPLGLNVSESWRNCLAGQSGVRPITHFDASAFSVRISASVQNFDIHQYISPKESKKMDTFIHYGLAAGMEAVKEAGLGSVADGEGRIGVAIGSGIGGIAGI